MNRDQKTLKPIGKTCVPGRFRRVLDQHVVLNFTETNGWPLILGIFGPPGDGKSFQTSTHLSERKVHVLSINAADLESDRAGQPGKLVLSKYTEAGERIGAGQPSVLLVDDFDTTVGEWTQSTGTVNHQQVLAQLMHLADTPDRAADLTLRRVPVIVTGNDLTKIYPPLRRPGRMRPFTWEPTPEERFDIVAEILTGLLDDAGIGELLAQCAGAPIAFFAELRTVILAELADSFIQLVANDLPKLVRDHSGAQQELKKAIQSAGLTTDAIINIARAEWSRKLTANISHLREEI